jgi:hypothetical protein
LNSDLVRGSVVDAERVGAATNIDAERSPRERLLENSLAEIASKEEPIGTVSSERGQEPTSAAAWRSNASINAGGTMFG